MVIKAVKTRDLAADDLIENALLAEDLAHAARKRSPQNAGQTDLSDRVLHLDGLAYAYAGIGVRSEF